MTPMLILLFNVQPDKAISSDLVAAVVMRPLTPDWTTQPVWVDGRSSREVIEEFIKPNDRMTAVERIELYNKQYWYRLIDIMYEDYPGLAAILPHSWGDAIDPYLPLPPD